MNGESDLEELAMTVPLMVGADTDYLDLTEKEIEKYRIETERYNESYSQARSKRILISIISGTVLGIASRFVNLDLEVAGMIVVGGYSLNRSFVLARSYRKLPPTHRLEFTKGFINNLAIDSACFLVPMYGSS